MQRTLLTLLAMAVVFTGNAQPKGTLYQTKLAGKVVLKDVKDDYNAEVFSLEAPAPDGNDDKIRLKEAKQDVAKRFPHKASNRAVRKTTAAKDPVVVKAYIPDSFSGTPPDNDMAISTNNKVVSVMNSSIAVSDGTTGTLSTKKTLWFFSYDVDLKGSQDFRYDPKVIYDKKADRYIVVMLSGRDLYNHIVVAFSQTNDPDGAWALYKFYGDYKSDSTWFDYPGVAITNDEFFLTGNKIKYAAPWETGFTETVVYQINKQDGYSGATTLNYKIWDGIKYDGKSIRNLFPVKPGWLPQGDEQYFVSNRNFDVQNDTIFLVKVPGKLGTGGNVSVTAMKAPISYGVPPNGRQTDTNFVLATNDGRILGAYAMHDEIQFVSTTIDTSNGSAGIFHGRISNYKTNPSVTYANIFSVDTLDFGYPNISFVGNNWGLNQSILNFEYTGPSTHAGLAAMMYDGTDYSNIVRLKEGDDYISRITGKDQRWGDYTGSQVDFNSPGSIWVVGLYGRFDHSYSQWTAKLQSPVVGINDTKKEISETKVFPNPAFEFVEFEFELAQGGNVQFGIYNTNGQLIDNILSKNCKEGKNLIRFNIAMLPVGHYVLTGKSESGATKVTERFIKQ
ncbi:MAG: T9SS type A sorting domain-containing protein [Chitinophagales bacterium]|nr:T9SS type A sorting domain-containing protein [Chitinophagaceae bacterium]MCB9065081.1 T9SS type A sorting domain-containing protein [Chitinophagales bacterium]